MSLLNRQSHTHDGISFGRFKLFSAGRLLLDGDRPVHLGGRAFDILLALVERAGEVVSKDELIERVWPNARVDEGSLRFHVASLRKALAEGESGVRYVTTLQGRGYCFVAPISRSNGIEPVGNRGSTLQFASQLPARLSRMVGRDETVQTLSAELRAERFITIVGPGGIGKTTVAVAVGRELLAAFNGAVCFLDLGPLSDPLLVPSAVASSLGLAVQSDDPVPGLIAYLRDKRILLILDSCEHVIDTAAGLAERIFREAPNTHILATSREVLRVGGENVRPLTPLDAPPNVPELTAAEALRFPAVQLFVQRMTASGYSADLTDSDILVAAEICRGLDGIALAIELAAGRVNTYGIRETAAQLGNRLKLLWEGRRTALPRHKTLGAALDWSYDFLRENERIVLQRLAVFVGVFTLEAAQHVTAGTDVDESQVSLTIVGLVTKSLLATETSATTTRHRLLDTTRAYALGKLLNSGDADQTARRHAMYYLKLLERTTANPAAMPDDRTSAGSGVLANVRAALEWSFLERGDAGLGVALAAASAPLFVESSLLTECVRWMERSLAKLDEKARGSRLEMELQSALGLSSMFTRGNSEQAGHALKRGLELAYKRGDLHNELRILGRLHIFHERIGDFRAALEYAERGQAVGLRIGDPVGIAEAHSALGISRHLEGDCAGARLHLEAASVELAASTRIDTFHFGFDYRNRARIALARVLWLEGFSEQAVTVARETVAEAETFNHPVTLCIALIWAVSVFLWNGDLDSADEYIDRFIDQADRYSLAPYQAVGRGVKGELLVRRGEPCPGVAQLHRALETLHELRYELLTTDFMTAIAEGIGLMGRSSEAIEAIDQTIAVVKRNGDLFAMPELLRVQGAIFMSMGDPETSKAEACLEASLDWATRQGALAWELRTATDIARLRAGQGRRNEARMVLAPAYDRFMEGFGNPDLTAARRLLNELD